MASLLDVIRQYVDLSPREQNYAASRDELQAKITQAMPPVSAGHGLGLPPGTGLEDFDPSMLLLEKVLGDIRRGIEGGVAGSNVAPALPPGAGLGPVDLSALLGRAQGTGVGIPEVIGPADPRGEGENIERILAGLGEAGSQALSGYGQAVRGTRKVREQIPGLSMLPEPGFGVPEALLEKFGFLEPEGGETAAANDAAAQELYAALASMAGEPGGGGAQGGGEVLGALRSGGGLGSVGMGPAPQVPAAVQQPVPNIPSDQLDVIRAMMAKSAPQGPSTEELEDLEFSGVLGGLAAGGLRNSTGSVADLMLGMGLGSVGGLASGQREKAAAVEEFERADSEFQRQMTELEAALMQTETAFEDRRNEAITQNALRKREVAIEQMQLAQPRVIGFTSNKLVVERTGANGQRSVDVIDTSSELEKLYMLKQIAGKEGASPDPIDLLSTEMDPNTAGVFKPMMLIANELADSGNLEKVLGKEALDQIKVGAQEDVASLGAIEPKQRTAETRRAILNRTMAYLIEHPQVLRDAAAFSPTGARVGAAMQSGEKG